MIVMTPHATPAEIDAVTTRLKTTGVHVVVMRGELTTAIGAIGDPEGVAKLGLAFKPRTSRFAFKGLGAEALEIARDVAAHASLLGKRLA